MEQADDVLKCFASLNVYDESEPWIFKTCDMRQVPFTVDCVAIGHSRFSIVGQSIPCVFSAPVYQRPTCAGACER